MKYLTDWNAFKENGSFNGNLFEDLVKEQNVNVTKRN